MGAAHAHIERIENTNDLGGQDGFQLQGFGVGEPKITEYVAASMHQFKIVVVHFKASFKRLSLSWIRSISTCGVLMPVFDFFWKAWMTQSASPICTA